MFHDKIHKLMYVLMKSPLFMHTKFNVFTVQHERLLLWVRRSYLIVVFGWCWFLLGYRAQSVAQNRLLVHVYLRVRTAKRAEQNNNKL